MNPTLLGVGTAVPKHTMSQEQAADLACDICCQTARQRNLLRVLYRKSHVKQRHTIVPYTTAYDWVDTSNRDEPGRESDMEWGPSTQERMQYYETHAPPLANQAAALAIERAKIPTSRISYLVTVTCTGFVAPGIDVYLVERLGLRPDVERVSVGFMGCHGAINGLRVARGLTAAEPHAHVLLCAVEVCSMHYRFRWDPERFLGNVLFADGAGAVVLGPTPQHGSSDWRIAATGSCIFPHSSEAMTWRIGNHGFEMTLSAEVPDLIQSHLRSWLERWLGQQGLSLSDVGSWAVHPGGPRILAAVEESLGLAADATAASREVLAQFGNMSSPTVLFIFEHLRRHRAARPCVMLGFGPGLVAEAALLI